MSIPAYIYDAIRTPRGKGKRDGSLHEVKPVDFLAGLLSELSDRHDLDTAKVDDVLIGCCTPIGDQGGDIGKTAVMVAEWDETVPAAQLDRYCASALDTASMASARVMTGWEQLIVAGGIECMSREPIMSTGAPWCDDPATAIKTGFVPMGIGADLIATLEGFSRQDVDEFACRSQEKAAAAQSIGCFNRSVIPVKDSSGLTILDKDEFIKPGTTVEGLSKLKPSFEYLGELSYDEIAISRYHHLDRINHVHHAGNSSGIVNGASLVLIGNETIGKEMDLTPRGRIVASALTSTEPTIMLTGPMPSTKKVLKLAGMELEDIDLFEVNEAFAAVPMLFQRETGVPWEKINVNGGAIAMGHPLGATGGILIGTVLDELERRDLRFGLCTLCAGAGIGMATIIERLS